MSGPYRTVQRLRNGAAIVTEAEGGDVLMMVSSAGGTAVAVWLRPEDAAGLIDTLAAQACIAHEQSHTAADAILEERARLAEGRRRPAAGGAL